MSILFILQLGWTVICTPALWVIDHYGILPLAYKYIVPILNTLSSEAEIDMAMMLFRNLLATYIYIFCFVVLNRVVSAIQFVFCVLFAPDTVKWKDPK